MMRFVLYLVGISIYNNNFFFSLKIHVKRIIFFITLELDGGILKLDISAWGIPCSV
jgi:hypothetical protein